MEIYFAELGFVNGDGFACGRDVVGLGILTTSEFMFTVGEVAFIKETAVPLGDKVTTKGGFESFFLIHL